MFRIFIFTILLSLGLTSQTGTGWSALSQTDGDLPPSLYELETIPKLNVVVETDSESSMPFDVRLDSMREAALSYGARGGLSWRTFHIRKDLETRARYMDKVFDFRQLLIPAPSGFLIEPPIISESINAMVVSNGGREAAVANRVYSISRNAKIVSSARDWRNYLEREWGEVIPPPDILRPENEMERDQWIEWVRDGWQKGEDQANDIFEQDLNQLVAHYQGMVRYRMLLAQGMVSPPYALQVDRGITGGGSRMRVGDRAVEITGMPELMPGTETWQPASR